MSTQSEEQKRQWGITGVAVPAGLFIGMGFDFEATNFHLRWNLSNEVRKWAETLGISLDRGEISAWLEQLRDACGPPLTPARTLGALGE